MGKVKNYSTDFKNKLIELFNSGVKQCEISKRLNIPKGTVNKIIKKYKTTGSTVNAKQIGRSKKCTNKVDRIIKRISQSDPRKSSREIANELRQSNIILSARTVRRRLVHMGLFGRIAVKKPLISKKNRKARLEFARTHISWSDEKWKTVLWSDESKFNIFGSDGKHYVRRPKDTRYSVKYQIPTIKHGGGSIMVWGCFSSSKTGPMIKIDGIMDRFLYRDILQNHMLPYAEWEMPLNWHFQQDNDPKHTSQLVKKFLNENSVDLIKWPSQSPDLNPIEHLWDYLDRQIRKKNISNRNEFWEELQKQWNMIPEDVCANLVSSMRRRCAAVIEAKGYATKY